MQQHAPLILSDPRWFDVAWAPNSPLLRTPLPLDDLVRGWAHRIEGPWSVHCPRRVAPPVQGWKVHVAALPDDSAETVRLVARACAEARVPFKHLRTRELVHASQLKYADPRSSGKVVTCYPAADQLESFATDLAGLLGEGAAPAIVGEVHVGRSPVWLRYGAILGRYRLSPDGTVEQLVEVEGALVPDQRGTRGAGPEPACVARWRREQAESASRLDIADVRVLHRSNAGGVYRASWDGRTVILKEARRHAGLDLSGSDAVTRLRHEHRALQRLSGTGVAPEPFAYLEHPESEFLVMEDLGRSPVMSHLSSQHPAVSREVGAEGVAPYVRWREDVLNRLQDLAATLAAHGIVHGDLQPANLVALPDRLVALDFESSSIDGDRPGVGVAAPGFGYENQGTGSLSDAGAITHLAAVLSYPPAFTILSHRPQDAAMLTAAGDAALHALARGERTPPCPSEPPDPDALTAGILAAATPHRSDRLFPGGLAQFTHPVGALGIAHGAAGVLAVLAATGHEPDPAHLDWLEDAADRCPPIRGLADGLDGVALTLARLGRPEAAARAWRRAEASGPFADGPGLGAGRAAEAVVAAALSLSLDDDGLRARADRAWDAVARDVSSTTAAAAEGIFSGWSGVGLALLNSSRPDAAALGSAALARGATELRTAGEALFTISGRTLWPYLGQGAAGLGVLAQRLGPSDDASRAAVVAGVAEACRVGAVYDAGLLHGRAGLLLTLRELTDDGDPWIEEHRRRLSWNCLPTRGRTDAVDVLGRHGLRASADLATGAAGVLLALSDHPWQLLAGTLGI